jgi:hypothetical protein
MEVGGGQKGAALHKIETEKRGGGTFVVTHLVIKVEIACRTRFYYD